MIDKTWMTSAVKVEPFGMTGLTGMATLYNVKLWGEQTGGEAQLARADYIKEHYIAKGKMGHRFG
ncbi:MAG: hypothetical protein GY816_05375 [Cytophagales bacterium]|nr:hypothetical protein [Cytophagales bacterium]